MLNDRPQEFSNLQITEGYSFIESGVTDLSTVLDTDGHGTMMASLVGGKICGVNKGAQIIPLRIGIDDADAQ